MQSAPGELLSRLGKHNEKLILPAIMMSYSAGSEKARATEVRNEVSRVKLSK